MIGADDSLKPEPYDLTWCNPQDTSLCCCSYSGVSPWRLEKVKPANGGYILSSGCALSSNVPVANVHAMVEAAEEFGYY